jgi:hypothetical protein
MLGERLLDLDRVHVLTAADDHVLDAIGQEQVALVIEIAAIAGAQPAVLGERRGCLLGAVEVSGHHVGRPEPDLPDVARAARSAGRRVHDAQLHPRVGTAR